MLLTVWVTIWGTKANEFPCKDFSWVNIMQMNWCLNICSRKIVFQCWICTVWRLNCTKIDPLKRILHSHSWRCILVCLPKLGLLEHITPFTRCGRFVLLVSIFRNIFGQKKIVVILQIDQVVKMSRQNCDDWILNSL